MRGGSPRRRCRGAAAAAFSGSFGTLKEFERQRWLCVCVCVYMSIITRDVYDTSIHQSIHPSMPPCMHACLAVYLSVCLSPFVSVCLCLSLSVSVRLCPSVSVCVPLCLSLSLCVCLSVCLSVCIAYVYAQSTTIDSARRCTARCHKISSHRLAAPEAFSSTLQARCMFVPAWPRYQAVPQRPRSASNFLAYSTSQH